MKTLVSLVSVALLAGCAATPAGLRLSDLRDEQYSHGERDIPLTYPRIQVALLKHKAACGEAAEFRLDPGKTAYATIIDKPSEDHSYERAILLDLTQYEPTMFREDPESRAQIYSYYADAATKRRIDQVFESIANPGVCPPAG